MLGVLPRTLRAHTLRYVPWFYPEQWLLSVEQKGHLPARVRLSACEHAQTRGVVQ